MFLLCNSQNVAKMFFFFFDSQTLFAFDLTIQEYFYVSGQILILLANCYFFLMGVCHCLALKCNTKYYVKMFLNCIVVKKNILISIPRF